MNSTTAIEPRSRRSRGMPARGSLSITYGFGPTPVGPVFVATTSLGVGALYLLDSADLSPSLKRLGRDFPRATIAPDTGTADTWVPRVVAWLNGVEGPDDFPLDLRGTPFQLRVWEALRLIPRGSTTTYGALSRSIGLPNGAARAVGTACGANPVSLFVPCHRVVSAGGGLGGYYWGLDRKRALLDLEGATV